MPRLEQLHQLLEKSPADAFLLYGIAMEHKKAGQYTQALEWFDQTISIDNKYCYAYYQKGQTFELLDDTESARKTYIQGIKAAQEAGDAHAAGEIQGAIGYVVKMVPDMLQFLHQPNWRRQHKWRSMVWKGMAGLGMTGMHSLPVHRQWVDVHRRDMPFSNLDPAFNGFRIIQISDLHFSPVVWEKYLLQFVHWVNELKPDLVVVTGDLITGGYLYTNRIAHILKEINATQGVICTFGNHDYSWYGKRIKTEGLRRADFLEKCLIKQGIIVLRNEELKILHNGSKTPLVVVGLDDELVRKYRCRHGISHIRSISSDSVPESQPRQLSDTLAFPMAMDAQWPHAR